MNKSGGSRNVARPIFFVSRDSRHFTRFVVRAILLQKGDLEGEGIGQKTGHLMITHGFRKIFQPNGRMIQQK